MATNDIRSNLEVVHPFLQAISSIGTPAGAIVDTADYDSGLMFSVMCLSYQDGDYEIIIDHGDSPSLTDREALPSDNYIGNPPTITATSIEGNTPLDTFGIFGNKRYVQIKIEATNVVSGAVFLVLALKKAEILPVIDA